MFVIPKDGLKIVDPSLRDFVPPEGRNVAPGHELYWQKRILEGDVIAASGADAATDEKTSSRRAK